MPESQVHHALEPGGAEDQTGTYHRGGETEIDWRNLDAAGLAHQAEVDAVIAAMKAQAAASEKRQPTPRSSRAMSSDPARTNPTRQRKAR